MSHSAGSAEVSVESGGGGQRAGRRLPGRRQKGSSLIEFALVMTFMLVPTTVGLAEFATYLANYMALTDAVATGARALAIARGTQDPCNVVATVVIPAYQAAAIEGTFTSSGMNFTITVTPPGGSASSQNWAGATSSTTPAGCYSSSTTPLTGFPASLIQHAIVTVKATYTPTLIFNAFPSLAMPIEAQTTEIEQ
ncbi:MAG: TadE/TadG family type IV pilus assembly protein [Candidatus Korobacteraceae bacterium]